MGGRLIDLVEIWFVDAMPARVARRYGFGQREGQRSSYEVGHHQSSVQSVPGYRSRSLYVEFFPIHFARA